MRKLIITIFALAFGLFIVACTADQQTTYMTIANEEAEQFTAEPEEEESLEVEAGETAETEPTGQITEPFIAAHLTPGHIVIEDNTLYFDEVEIITLADFDRLEELGL